MSSQIREDALQLLRLPRELRDMIYPHLIDVPHPIPLYYPKPHPITSPAKSHPVIAAEALEAYYQHNAFILDIKQTPRGSEPLDLHRQIRHLVIQADESFDETTTKTHLEFETEKWDSPERRFWRRVLDFPDLETLQVKLRKTRDITFFWLDFSPILYALRARKPKIQISFLITFDVILEKAWNNPHWWTFVGATMPDHYEPMGYIDVSDMFGPPTEEDQEYVKEFLPNKKMPPGRSVSSGLLDEKPSQRRVLGEWYVVKEPALMRVLMEDQYRVYEECEKNRRANSSD